MVAPITGPFVTSEGGTGASSTYLYKERWKQKPPFTVTLPYTLSYSTITTRSGNRTTDGAWQNMYGVDMYVSDVLVNIAYAIMRSKVCDRAELAVTLAEYDQSATMIRQRCKQMARFARHLRRGNFWMASVELGSSSVPKRVRKDREFADNFLEYSFGWAPLIGDIGSAVNVLQSPLDAQYVRGSFAQELQTVFSDMRYTNYGNYYSFRQYRMFVGKARASMGCAVAVNNPNLWLANQMGFVNPASVAWELVPFSFVVDWFMNVGDVLAGMTDFIGLTVEQPWTSRSFKGVFYDMAEGTVGRLDTGVPRYVANNVIAKQAGMKRTQGLTRPVLVPPYRLLNLKQAALSAALVIQRLVR